MVLKWNGSIKKNSLLQCKGEKVIFREILDLGIL